jgi:D-3-phosphoglycerate dehydrogenase / 2-oxoglutarate reductase
MKILLADKFPGQYADELTNSGHQITSTPDLSADDMPQAIQDNEIVVVRSTKVTADTINAATNLKMIIRAGAGFNTIDTATAAEKNIPVCNTPGKNALAVAELAFGLLLAIDRNIPDNVIEMRNNNWDKKRFSKTQGICGRTCGVVGLGQIGLGFAKRAQAFGMKLYGYDIPQRIEQIQGELNELDMTATTDLNEIAQNCDVITFHVPSIEATKGMINKNFLANCQDNAIIINTSRGNIAVDDDLIEAMNTKNIRTGLDVFNNEPTSGKDTINTALSQHPNVYGTHHIGASTEQAQNAVAQEVVNVINNLNQGNIINCVNLKVEAVTA